MAAPRILVLPGLDGWAAMRREFGAALERAHFRVELTDYEPTDRMSYDAIRSLLDSRAADIGTPLVIVAESYSGPAAIEFAFKRPGAVAALALVSTFAVAPGPRWLGRAVPSSAFRFVPPARFIRHVLVGPDASDSIVRQSRRALGRLHPSVAAARLRQALRADVRSCLDALSVPTLALLGRQDRVLRKPNMLSHHPKVHVHPVDGPHALLTCRPIECAAAVTEFLQSTTIPS